MAPKPPVDPLSPTAILSGLKTRWWRGPVWHYDTLPSTNDLAKEMGLQGAPEGTVVVAEGQTAGRGRLGRQWHSPPGVGLYISLLLRPNLPLVDLPKITLTAGVAVVRAIQRTTGVLTGIKWPNDIMLAGKKVGGILSEMSMDQENSSFVVVGLGLNVNNPEMTGALAGVATSLAQETGRYFSRARLAQGWLEELEGLYTCLLTQGFAEILNEWRKLAVTLGRWVIVRQGSQEIQGLALEVAPDGALVVQRPGGEVVRLTSGEILPGSGGGAREY